MIGYPLDRAAFNSAAGAQAVRMLAWVNSQFILYDGLTSLGADAAEQAAALVGMGFPQEEADAMVYKIGAMTEAARILSGQIGLATPFHYLDATKDLRGLQGVT